MPTHNIKQVYTYSGSGIDTISSTTNQENTDTATILIEEAIIVSTDTLVAMVMDVSEMSTLMVTSTEVITLNTNDIGGGSPAKTFTIGPDDPQVWALGWTATNPWETDITALYITNASGSTADVVIRILYDSTV
jgi:hypothetical protein